MTLAKALWRLHLVLQKLWGERCVKEEMWNRTQEELDAYSPEVRVNTSLLIFLVLCNVETVWETFPKKSRLDKGQWENRKWGEKQQFLSAPGGAATKKKPSIISATSPSGFTPAAFHRFKRHLLHWSFRVHKKKTPNITFKKYWGTTIFSNTSAKIKVIIDLQHEIYTPVDTMFHSEAGTLEMPEVTKYFADTVAYYKI